MLILRIFPVPYPPFSDHVGHFLPGGLSAMESKDMCYDKTHP